MKIYVPKPKMIPIILLVFMYVLKNAYVIRQSTLLTSFFDNAEWVIYIILILSVLCAGYKIRQLVLIGIVILLLGICYLSSGQADLIKACILVVYLKGTKEKELFHQLFQAFLLAFIIVLILYVLGISDAGATRRNGLTLGFATTNIASRMIQCTIFSWMVSKRKDIRFAKLFLVTEMVAVFIFLTTGSRASTIIVAISPLIIYFINFLFGRKRGGIILKILSLLPIVFLAVTIITAYLYESSSLVQLINSIFLSNRIYMNYVALDNFGIGLLGQSVNISSLAGIYDSASSTYVNFLTIDSHYTYLIVYYGIIGTIIWMAANLMTFHKAVTQKNAAIITVLLLLNVYAITETMGSIFAYFPLMYLLIQPNVNDVSDFGLRSGKRSKQSFAEAGS